MGIEFESHRWRAPSGNESYVVSSPVGYKPSVRESRDNTEYERFNLIVLSGSEGQAWE